MAKLQAPEGKKPTTVFTWT